MIPDEKRLLNKLKRGKWVTFHNGYPDFMAELNGRIIAVEVKKDEHAYLTKEQQTTMGLLEKLGVECYRWTPDRGFCHYKARKPQGFNSSSEPITFWKHLPEGYNFAQIGRRYALTRQAVRAIVNRSNMEDNNG